MIKRLLFILLTVTSFASVSSAEDKSNKDLKGVLSFEFGEIGDNRKITSSTQIPWRIGGKYGWAATIFSKDPKVVLKEILILPAPAVLNESNPKKKPEQVLSSDMSVSDERILTKEVTLDVTKPLKYQRVYTLIENDPQGPHVLRLYVNGELAREVNFTVEKNTKQGSSGEPATRLQTKSEGSDKPQPEAEGRSR